MAELALTCLGNIAEGFLGKVGQYLFAPIQRQLKYMCCFNSNITELETQLKKLETTKEGVQLRVNEGLRNVRIIAPEVENWLERAYEVTLEVEGIIQDKARVNEGCLFGWCPMLSLRYSLSRKAVEKTKVVVDLQAGDVSYTELSYRPEPPCLETITNRDFMGFESRRANMEEIVKALTDDRIKLIGICGMAGVGKTKMVQEVRKRAKEEKLFDEVAFVAVGRNPDITKVQNSIADIFGLNDLKTKDDATTRASLLRRRLSQDNKKILLILDDIWAEFNLEDYGIPLGGSHETFKIIYTSRFQGIWHVVPNKKEIPLELLLEDEAWHLFREKAGDSADATALQPIAKQIVNECGCLPLALVLIGTALSKKSVRNTTTDIWEEMLDRLTCASNTPADEQLSLRLALSYEYLEDKQAKRLFLLCCSFQEDEDLAKYGLGLPLFDGINEMEKVRRPVLALVDDLKSNYLLLDGKDDEFVKVHDVVRYVGISIAAKDSGALVSHGEVSEWPKDTYEDYTSISLISTKITELPKGLTCPNLEFLQLNCRKLKELPCQFFEGMGKLKVLLLKNFEGILALPSSLRNLHTLSLQSFNGTLDNVSEFGGLFNLKILSFRDSRMKELPEAIGELVNLRLLNLTNITSLERIPARSFGELTFIQVHNCGRLRNLFQLPIGGCLPKLEHLKISACGTMEEVIWKEQQEDVHAATNRIEFPKLKLLELEKLPSLMRFCRGIDQIDFPQLKKLHLRDIPQVNLLFHNNSNLSSNSKGNDNFDFLSLFPEKVILPVLEVLEVHRLGNIVEIWDKQSPWLDEHTVSFGKLRDVKVQRCEKLMKLVPSNILPRLDKLQKLCVEGCPKIESVVFKNEKEGAAADDSTMIIPQLQYLRISDMENLKSFYYSSTASNAPSLFNHQVVLPVLEVLEVDQLGNIVKIWDMQSPWLDEHTLSFGKLRDVKVQRCEKLMKLVPSNILPRLNKLQKLCVEGCPKIESVVFKNEKEGAAADDSTIIIPQLQYLRISDMENLKSFYSSSTASHAQSLFNHQVILPVLEVFEVDWLGNIVEIWDKQSPWLNQNTVSSFELRDMKVQQCKALMNLVPSNILPRLEHLQKLYVEGCPNIESIFFENEKEEEAADASSLIIPQLQYLRISDMEKLKSFYSGSTASNAQSLFNHQVTFPRLKILELEGCASLRNIFHPSMVKVLQNLGELIVNDCSKMESVIDKEEEQQDGQQRKTDKLELRRLSKLELRRLPELRTFCHFTRPLELRLLSKMVICDCPRMDSFSSGPVSTPNLCVTGFSRNG